MAVIISGRGLVLTPEFKALVERKVAKLDRVLRGRVAARVVCEAEKFRRTARLTVRVRRRTLTGEATAADLLVAVEDALDALRRQARETKERRRRSRGRPERVA